MSYGRRAPRVPKISEADIQRTCTELLELDGWRALRTDPVSRREWGKGFGEKGMADYLYIRYADYADRSPVWASQAQVLWVEYKSRRGSLKPHQKVWIDAERDRGAFVAVTGETFVPSVDGFVAWYNQSGLARRRLTIAHSGDPLAELGRIAGESIAKCPRP